MKRLVLCLYFIVIASFGLFSQQVLQFSESLEWETTNFTWQGEKQSLPICNSCYTAPETYLPTFTKAYPISNTGKMTAKVINPQYQVLETGNYSDFIPTDFAPQRLEVNTTLSIERKKTFAQVSFTPIVKRNGQWFKITDFDLEITPVSYTHLTLPTICSV